MKTAILYASLHHHNTEKLIKAITEKYPGITLIDTTKAKMKALANYDLIGIASGIYFGKFHKSSSGVHYRKSSAKKEGLPDVHMR